jgi:aryl-alcohol dehydrogenase-like predicted oxidoreductase
MCCRLCIRGGASILWRGGAEKGGLFSDAADAGHRLLRVQSAGPGAGGYFSKSVEELRVPPKGTRMDEMSAFQEIDVSDARIRLLESLREACDRHGMAVKEATLRWFMHHSALGGTRTG